jgi:hypothetical protein
MKPKKYRKVGMPNNYHHYYQLNHAKIYFHFHHKLRVMNNGKYLEFYENDLQ